MTRTSGKLEITTPGDNAILMTRELAAPRAVVWDAFTRPELVRRWLLGPDGWDMVVCEIDLRVGGRYRYVWRRRSNGTEMGMGGVYREVAAPERLVSTERFDQPWYDGEAVGTLVLTERGGRTRVAQTMRYASKAVRDAVLASGMESGVAASYDRLEAQLAARP